MTNQGTSRAHRKPTQVRPVSASRKRDADRIIANVLGHPPPRAIRLLLPLRQIGLFMPDLFAHGSGPPVVE